MSDEKVQVEKLKTNSEKDLVKALHEYDKSDKSKNPWDTSHNGDAENINRNGPASSVLDQLISTIDTEIQESHSQDEAVSETDSKGQDQYIVFSLAGARYGMPINNVIEVGRVPNITPLPRVPTWLRGVANIRGDIISVIDLRLFLGIERMDQTDSSRMLVVRSDGNDVTTALIVDQVNRILDVPVNRAVTPAAPIKDKASHFLRGIYEQDNQILVLLDLERFLHLPEMQQFE